MTDYAVIIEAGTLEIRRVLPGPIARVWDFLVQSGPRGKWLASGAMDLRPGGDVHLHFDHAGLSPTEEPIPERYRSMEGGHDSHGRVIECEPLKRLSFSWDESDVEPSEVAFDLYARGDEVLLVVTHRGLADHAAMVSVASGWHTHLDILVDQLNGAVPRPFWSSHAVLEAVYKRRFDA